MEENDGEVWLRECEAWVVDARALCARFKGEYMPSVEGGALVVGISGKGEVSLAELLLNEGKPSLSVVKP